MHPHREKKRHEQVMRLHYPDDCSGPASATMVSPSWCAAETEDDLRPCPTWLREEGRAQAPLSVPMDCPAKAPETSGRHGESKLVTFSNSTYFISCNNPTPPLQDPSWAPTALSYPPAKALGLSCPPSLPKYPNPDSALFSLTNTPGLTPQIYVQFLYHKSYIKIRKTLISYFFP